MSSPNEATVRNCWNCAHSLNYKQEAPCRPCIAAANGTGKPFSRWSPVPPAGIKPPLSGIPQPQNQTAPATNLTDTLIQRGSRYGVFRGHAEVTQRLKDVIGSQLRERNKMLAPDQQEALDMICHKIGRIINGDADYDDSWIDIAGYAQLIADRLRGVSR